jgi:hypothetical protein
MRSLLKFGCAFLIAVCIGVVAQSALAANWGTDVAASRSEKFAALHARAAQQGEVALIVRFDEIGAPLPTLPPQAQQARMQAIAAMRERLLTELTGWGPLKNVKRFDYTPHVAFSADASVLRVLEFHPLALEVAEDGLRAPTLG